MSANPAMNRGPHKTITHQELVSVVIKGEKEAIKLSLVKVGLPRHVSSGIADQIMVAVELIKKGGAITPSALGAELAKKAVGIAKFASGGNYQCGFDIATVLFTIIKAGSGGPSGILLNAIKLLYDLYVMDQSCGFTKEAERKLNEVLLPIVVWLDQGGMEALRRQSF